jgi:hypothetical protein
VAQVTDAVLDQLATWVVRVTPEIADRIPTGAAVELGRSVAPAGPGFSDDDDHDSGEFEEESNQSPVLSQLGALSPLLAERLYGALELTVEHLDLTGTPSLAVWNLRTTGGFLSFWMGTESQTLRATRILEQLSPGTVDSVAELAQQIASHPLIADLLEVPASLDEESAIVAAQGRAYLALTVATTTAALGPPKTPALWDRSAAVVGIGLSTASGLLRKAPAPAGYPAALLSKIRAEYLLPRGSAGSVPVSEHRFALLEGAQFPEGVDFGGNGLVTVVPGGAVIRTGTAEGWVNVELDVLEEPPAPPESGWDDVVEVSWSAAVGTASVLGPNGPADPQLLRQTPPWPGDYRLRVYAQGRDDIEDDETYALMVWAAPATPEVVHRRTDRLGHQLRGQPVPARIDRPELAYHWITQTSLSEAATITVITGSTVEQVLRAFGADPTQPQSLEAVHDDLMTRQSIDPCVAVLDTGDAVIAVEYNGFEGADAGVLTRAATERAASMYWNVNALTRLSFAEHGRILASFEPPDDVDAGPVIAAALAGLDFEDYRHKVGKGLVAVERFTGYAVTADDLARIEEADIGFWITPDR